jgi:hypothetical protein
MNALRLDVMIPTRVRCSAPDCLEHAELPSLPLIVPDVGAVPRVDRAEVAVGLPAGWKVGSMVPRGAGLFLGDQPVKAEPVPVAFCPTHNPERA